MLQVGSGSNEKSTGSGGQKINGSDWILIPGFKTPPPFILLGGHRHGTPAPDTQYEVSATSVQFHVMEAAVETAPRLVPV